MIFTSFRSRAVAVQSRGLQNPVPCVGQRRPVACKGRESVLASVLLNASSIFANFAPRLSTHALEAHGREQLARASLIPLLHRLL